LCPLGNNFFPWGKKKIPRKKGKNGSPNHVPEGLTSLRRKTFPNAKKPK
jgi:hypothetical protein